MSVRKLCLYSPYIPKHTGGGERYLFDVALAMTHLYPNDQIFLAIAADLFTSELEIKDKYQRFLGQSLDKLIIIPAPVGTNESVIKKLWWTKQWDVLYYLTDGSLFFSLARRNILHIQFPLRINKSSFVEQLKLNNWHIKNTNSEFTKHIVQPSWPVKVNQVHHPQIQQPLTEMQLSKILPKKENIILHVGRFFRQLHSKRQDVMIGLFKELRATTKAAKGWKLVLVGSIEDQSYADEIVDLAEGLPIQIIHDCTRQELLDLYQKASIYWHATGYGIDPVQHPEKVEHFGISTAEAMSYGCAPVVIKKGGQPEVLGAELQDLLWNEAKDCIAISTDLLTHPNKLRKYQRQAHGRASIFRPEVFERKLKKMIEG